MMNIQSFKLMIVAYFVSVSGISLTMGPQTQCSPLITVVSRTHFNQFEPKEIRCLALTCKEVRTNAITKRPELWQALQETGRKLFDTYQNKYVHPDCIFAHCVYHSKYDEVQWLLKNKTVFPLCILENGYPSTLNCYDIAKSKSDEK